MDTKERMKAVLGFQIPDNAKITLRSIIIGLVLMPPSAFATNTSIEIW